MNIHPVISVIVPVYNTENYLQECIDSILAQDFTNFELILVDDGSPDKCGKICDLNAEQDKRIRVIHQTNQGVTRARANGVEAAKGDFITFVDSDDTIPPYALATLAAYINENVDVILGNVQLANSPCPSAGEIELSEYRQMCVVLKGIHNGPYAKLFRRRLFNRYVFGAPKELRVWEDAIMNIRLSYQVEGKIFSCGTVVYEYRNNEESVTHTLAPCPEMEILFATIRLQSFPPEDLAQHVGAGLYKNLIAQWLNALYNTPKLSSKELPYINFLYSIRKTSGYKFNIFTYLLFRCNSQTRLNLFFKAYKILKRLKNYIPFLQKSQDVK